MQYSIKDHFGWTRIKEKGHTYLSEMQYRGKTWFNEFNFKNLTDTKSSRIDLMVLNEDGIGFVELKVNNENCGNLDSHINHMNYILSHKEKFLHDAERRVEVLLKYDLLEREMERNLDEWKKTKNIWCGILFVGKQEHLAGTKEMIKKQLESLKDGIKCAFVDSDIVYKGELNLSKDVFVLPRHFVEESFKGLFK